MSVLSTRPRGVLQLTRELASEVPRAGLRFGAALLLSLLASLSGVVLMGASGWLISRAAEHPPVLHLQVAIVVVRACGLSRAVFRYLERLVSHEVALQLQSALRIRTYAHLAATTLLGRRRGDLLIRVVSDVAAVMDLVVRVAVPFASAGLLAVAVSAAVGVLSPVAGLALLVSAVLAGWIVPRLAALASRRADAETVGLRAELAVLTRELNRSAYDLAAYGDTSRRDALLAVDARMRAAESRAAVVRGAAAGLQVLAAGAAVLVALWVGVPAVADGSLSRVNLAVLVLVPLALHEVLAPLTQAAQTLTRARTALDRVGEVLAALPIGRGDRADERPDPEPLLELDRATLGWPVGQALLTEVSLGVRPGERVALVGPSGIGKTTAAATLMGLIPPLAGSATTRGTVGYLAQDAHIFNTSVAENVRIGNRDASDDEVRTALARAGLELPLQRIVGEEGSKLSGGEARRLALARVLVGVRQCWILDEPTEHLDAETAEGLLEDLWRLTADGAVLVITHDQRLADACDRVVRLG
ncbi:thiol reductant ABC exporter subunit CydC [Enemella dayhoffiae]|uniref:Thiol reductant ABC exporter subunit CydC n=1 Tax=Enemella dayhoffiae TaxID=2016507 RepID=A0A255HBQ2_9ACTN|nr:thiol reductant ABC exporter subunit CydC [Enemella dayhoffiae]OYO25109.1 thiol reductant ABC exporter subunit CydC [Enemella dayhoffiae]